MTTGTNPPAIEELKKSLETAKSIIILLPQNPSLDATAAALALFLSLRETGRNAVIGSSSEMRVEQSRLVGIDKVTDKIGNRNLIITFGYKEDSIEKVSYNVEGDKFNLVVQPRPGYPPLEKDNVEFSYEGMEADLIFIIGAQKLENLGAIYEKERQAFSGSTLVNIDRVAANTKFGNINFTDPKTAAISELAFQIIRGLSLPLNVDIAGNLLKGIEAQTQNFQSPLVGAETFEAVAELIRAGAKRSFQPTQTQRQWFPGQSSFPSPARPLSFQQPPPPMNLSETGYTPPAPRDTWQGGFPQTQTASQPARLPVKGSPTPPVIEPSQIQDFTSTTEPSPGKPKSQKPDLKNRRADTQEFRQENTEDTTQQLAKEDWKGPKIYQGKTKV